MGFERCGRVAQRVGDVLGFHGIPFAMCRVVVHMDGRVRRGAGKLQMQREAREGFRRAEERVGVGFVADLLAPDGVLLVGEGERRVLDARQFVVIQRRRGSVDNTVVDGEVDVAVAEGLAASFGVAVDVFGGAKEPVEADNDQVDDVCVERAVHGVISVKGLRQAAEDGDVDWIDSGGWVIFVAHGFVERSQ